MNEEPVVLTREGDIAYITLNRPQAANGIDLPLARALMAAAIACENDAAVRCVVLNANGKLFSGGGDIAGFRAAADNRPAYLSELVATLNSGLAKLMRMSKPLLALVHGPAAGAGFALAMAADVVLAARSANFTAAYGQVGLCPDGGMSWLLPRLVGLRKAQEILILNPTIGAQEAADLGLVTRVFEDDKLSEEGQAVAERLAASATGAIGKTRALLLNTFSDNLESHLSLEMRLISAAGGASECEEGVDAFFARRAPDFPAAAAKKG